MFQRLLRAGCDVESDYNNRTLLMQAALHGHARAVRYIVENCQSLGIDIHQRDKDGRNALFYWLVHYATLHYTTLHYTTLHYTTLHYTTLRYTTLRYTTLLYATLRYATLHYATLHYTTLRYTTLRYTTLHHCTTHTLAHTQYVCV